MLAGEKRSSLCGAPAPRRAQHENREIAKPFLQVADRLIFHFSESAGAVSGRAPPSPRLFGAFASGFALALRRRAHGAQTTSKERTMAGAGAIDKATGRLKEAAGALTDDDRLRAEGKIDQAAGKVKDAAEKAVDKIKKLIDEATK
jgi:uncharacterized protein YjbJ (UPF0337 family)